MADQWTTTGAQPPAEERPSRDRRLQTRIVLTGVAVVLFVWFAVANFQDVKIRFWVTTAAAPLIVVVIISGFLGAAASSLWRLRRRRRPRAERR